MKSGKGVTAARRSVVQTDEAKEKSYLEKMENERTKNDIVCDQITWEDMKESFWGTDGEAGHMVISLIVRLLPDMRYVGGCVYACAIVRGWGRCCMLHAWVWRAPPPESGDGGVGRGEIHTSPPASPDTRAAEADHDTARKKKAQVCRVGSGFRV